MNFKEFCNRYHINSEKLVPMLVVLMKKHYPGLSSLSDRSIKQYADMIDLSDQFYIELSKYVKLWTFS